MLINGGEINGAEINGLFTAPIVIPPIVVKKTISKQNFIATLTGAADGVSDVIIPISSISGSINDVGNHSILIVCPDGFTYGGLISERLNGGFIITTIEVYTDGTSASVDSYEYALSTMASDRGARSFSISLRGTASILETEFDSYIGEGISILSVNTSGKYRVRLDYNSDIRPGDTLIIDDTTNITVGIVKYTISERNMYMTITEA